MSNPPVPIITLTTDFGLDDYFVAAMKGVILSINPSALIIDITHMIPAHDIRAGAFTLAQASREFPHGTIHVVVVDPGVGSSRKPLIVKTQGHFFVGPDNGVFSFILEEEPVEACIHITAERFFRQPVSHTFHGRDIFAPVAAWLSKGVDADSVGPRVSDVVTFEVPRPVAITPHHIRGHVIHVDRFGNLITNLTERELSPRLINSGARLRINKKTIRTIKTHFAEAASGKAFGVFGSTGRLEIAMFRGSATNALNASVGAVVDVIVPKFEKSPTGDD